MLLCLENLQGGFCDISCSCIFISFLIFILLFFFVCRFSSFFFDVIPHPSVDCRRVFNTHFMLSAQPIAEWFATLSFSTIPFSSCRGGYGLAGGHFLPTGVSCLALLHRHFDLCLSRLPWGPAVLPWSLQGFILILGTQALPICLLVLSNPHSFFNSTIYYDELLVVKD